MKDETPQYTRSFVIYESWFDQCERLRKKGKAEMSAELLRAIMRYGLYGELPPREDETEDVWDYGFSTIYTQITRSQDNKGKKIKIDKEELERLYLTEGKTREEIAQYYGCHKNTIQNRLTQYNIRKYGENEEATETQSTATEMDFSQIKT